jgi:hypothetical protein
MQTSISFKGEEIYYEGPNKKRLVFDEDEDNLSSAKPQEESLPRFGALIVGHKNQFKFAVPAPLIGYNSFLVPIASIRF